MHAHAYMSARVCMPKQCFSSLSNVCQKQIIDKKKTHRTPAVLYFHHFQREKHDSRKVSQPNLLSRDTWFKPAIMTMFSDPRLAMCKNIIHTNKKTYRAPAVLYWALFAIFQRLTFFSLYCCCPRDTSVHLRFFIHKTWICPCYKCAHNFKQTQAKLIQVRQHSINSIYQIISARVVTFIWILQQWRTCTPRHAAHLGAQLAPGNKNPFFKFRLNQIFNSGYE